ncbi:hypothetical protein GIV75_28880 [Pseudomonas sp. PA-3-5D]|uniref:hypothetical protein n=2 Tax=Pseudomonas TaxID=286 RepID=UPI001F3C138A|nr:MULTISPECIES: hypothetical protein [unclassified Pseudomonas]MCF5511738.1 hypothetical protein [Pseudomonas sp. PA-3-6H]MCF5564851.1 hypothetical protein [Pseudomonas sp. PA-3-5D]
MNTLTTEQYLIDKLEEYLEHKIETLVKSIDDFLTQHSEGIAYVPKPMLKVFEGFSSFKGNKRYRVTKNHFGYALPAPKSRHKTDFSSYESNKMIHHLFLAIAYHGYDYDSHNFGLVLPKVVNHSIYSLAYWGVDNINAKKSNEKPLTSINNVFTLITTGQLGDYINHVEGINAPNLIDTTIDRVVNIKVDPSLNLTFILNDEHCIIMVNKKGLYAKVSDETIFCVGEYEFLLTPDGVIVAEMTFIGKQMTKYDFKEEVKKVYSGGPFIKTKAKK